MCQKQERWPERRTPRAEICARALGTAGPRAPCTPDALVTGGKGEASQAGDVHPRRPAALAAFVL